MWVDNISFNACTTTNMMIKMIACFQSTIKMDQDPTQHPIKPPMMGLIITPIKTAISTAYGSPDDVSLMQKSDSLKSQLLSTALIKSLNALFDSLPTRTIYFATRSGKKATNTFFTCIDNFSF